MVEVNEDTSTSTVTDESDNEELNVMLAFFYNTPNFPRGTITSYGYSETADGYSQSKKFDYSLCYWGENCIYEKFYQKMDEMYRNSLHEIKGDFLIPSALKGTIKAEYPVLLDGQIMLINSMGYTIGEMEPMETTLFTTHLHTPVTTGPRFKDYSDVSYDKENSLIYYWAPNYSSVEITEGEYNSVSVKQTVPSVMFAEDYPQKSTIKMGDIMNKLFTIKLTGSSTVLTFGLNVNLSHGFFLNNMSFLLLIVLSNFTPKNNHHYEYNIKA